VESEAARVLDRLPHKTVGLFAGNRGGKTSTIAYIYIKRLLGISFCDEKNRLAKKIRCISSTLPGTGDVDSQDNAQYIELRKLIPPEMILQDITARTTTLVVKSPVHGKTVFEFRSSKQEMQDLGKISVDSVWHDEETPKEKREECRMRLMETGGDEVFSCTATNPLCFDEETELLTRRGWKRGNEISIDDEAWTYSIERDRMEWEPLQGFRIYRHCGPMARLKNGSFDFLVTKNHRWVVCNDRRRNDLYLEETQKLNSKHIIKRLSENVLSPDDNPEYDDRFISIVGWLCSDGTNNTDTAIYQSVTAYPQKCRKLDELLSGFGDNVRVDDFPYGDKVIDGKLWCGSGTIRRWSITRDLRKRLRSVVDGKSPNQDFICSLSSRQLSILLDAIMDGDGYVTDCGGMNVGQIGNEGLIDGIQLIATLLGKLSHKIRWVDEKRGKVFDKINIYANSERFWPNTHVKSVKITEEDYDGFIWCPTVENGTIVVRRNGTVSISGNSYLFDEVYQQASYVFRTKSVVEKYGLAREEKRNTGKDIACIQMATDDNPILDKAVIDSLFEAIDDPDVLALRRYGIFKSISGRVFKSYDPSICYIPFKKYFPNGIPYDWFHCRGIDYHESRTPWSVGWMSVSPKNEWFLWREFHPPIDGPNSFTTGEITKHIARNSEGYYYSVDLIDPLATKKQPNTGYSVVEDLNREFHRLKEDDRIGTGAYFCGWDTKGTLGRDEISARFKNARKCQAPFNNAIRDRGIVRHLPTLWVCDTAPNFHRSLLNWCYGEWGTAGSRAVNDPKPVPQQKNSHDPMVLEAFAKDSRIIHAADYMRNRPNFRTYKPASITGR